MHTEPDTVKRLSLRLRDGLVSRSSSGRETVRGMKISLVTDTYLPEVNGVTTVLATMRQGLLARGHAVQVIAPRYGTEAEEAGIVRRTSISLPGYSASRLVLPLGGVGRAIDDFAPDVVHVVTEGVLGGFGRRHALRRRLPLVTSFHTDFPRYAARYVGEWAVAPVRRYLRWFHAPSAFIQTPSATTRTELAAMGLPQAVVWGRGVDTALFSPSRRSETRRAAMGAARRPMVLHVSRLAVEKDVDTLVAAFREARAALGEAVVFVVAGDGPKAAEVRTALPFALHRGFLRRSDVADLYADSDLFVFPSPTETCGLVVLEAMASGVPVVASDTGGVLENMRDGLNGRSVRVGDARHFSQAILELLAAPERRHAMGQAARAFAVARDWARELDALAPMYRQTFGAEGFPHLQHRTNPIPAAAPAPACGCNSPQPARRP
jgi:glycosyltransferase involved in cell wall biosynthesis